MSSESMAHQVEYEEVVENIDMEDVLEGTRWEDSFDEGEPFAKEVGGLLGAMGGYALGEILGRGVGGMIDRELAAMDERMNEDAEAADEGDDQQESSAGTTADRDESPSFEEDASGSDDDGPDKDVSDIGGGSV